MCKQISCNLLSLHAYYKYTKIKSVWQELNTCFAFVNNYSSTNCGFSAFHIILQLGLDLNVKGICFTWDLRVWSQISIGVLLSSRHCSLVAIAVVRKAIFHCPLALTPAIPRCLTPCCLATTSRYIPERTNQRPAKHTALVLCTQ